ncbi:hypothetical protein E2562_023524 [Oryza meyeriana var. granulata]|uniref:Ubiquitin-like domain-containing protein n=1 Tax=Oryza meyeriana var. granulata TaxID=110450 RepID=A0A6G1E1K3_9ORYZ|nr:hypothetical protein E2562_023524 [Oryza meyeriana var. granulata]
MIHSGCGRAGRRRRNGGSKGPYERGGDGEGDGSARARTLRLSSVRRLDTAATDAKAGSTSTLSSGCCDLASPPAKAAVMSAPAWMEEFSDSTLCKKWNTQEEVKEGHVKVNVPAPSSCFPNSSLTINPSKEIGTIPCGEEFCNCEKGLQFTINVFGVTISLQQKDICNTMVGSLVESSCRKIGVNASDSYAVLGRKVLDYNEPLSHYPLTRDSTVEVRYRARAGQQMTFNRKFNVTKDKLFRTVQLGPELRERVNIPQSVKFFSDFASYNLQKVLMHVTGLHLEGWSYNGAFESNDIIFHNGAVTIQNTPMVPFDKDSCARDYAKLSNIFKAKFLQLGYPLYFSHLILYLHKCPDGANSNHEAIVAFVTNHPSIESYFDRMKQLMILDCLLDRHPTHYVDNIVALGRYSWIAKTKKWKIKAIWDVYNHVPRLAPARWKNPLYTDDAKGCLHLANNFLKHGNNKHTEDELDAAFCRHMVDYLPVILERLARLAQRLPDREYIINLLSNRLADTRTGN